MTVRYYDLIVIGSGPAGEKGAAQAAYFGKQVALVEREPHLGGAGCNTGTIPSKTLRETAVTIAGFRTRALAGVELSLRADLSVQQMLAHERRVASAERERIERNMRRHNVDIYHGAGSFADPNSVKVESDSKPATLEAPVILIATGSSPRRSALFPFENPRVWDSDRILEMEDLPRSLAVIGAGIIGCEYASIFAALGVRVHLIDERAELLPVLDRDVWAALEACMQAMNVSITTGAGVRDCLASESGVRLSFTSGKDLDVDAVLVSTGRTGNTEALNLPAAGITADARGRVPVNHHYQTEAGHIYAAGDVIGSPALASTSMEQARIAMVHAFDLGYKKFVAPILPMGIYTIPEVSVAGETERTLTEKGVNYVTGRADYSENARGMIIGDERGFLKLIFSADEMRLLGIAVVGEGAAELIHAGMLALMSEAAHNLFIEACFNYPALGQLYKYATYDAMGKRAAASA